LGHHVGVLEVSNTESSILHSAELLCEKYDISYAIISKDLVRSELVLLMLLYNAISSHLYSYNKMRKISYELLLVLSGKNLFPEAVESTKPKSNQVGLFIAISNSKELITKFLNELEEKFKDYFKKASFPSFRDEDFAFIEELAMFYVRYR